MAEAKVYFVLTDTGSVLSQTIKLFTKKKYNHCSLAFDARLGSTYSFGRKKPQNPFIGGFVQEDTCSDYFLAANCAVYSLVVTENQIKRLHEYIEEMEEVKSDLHYNFLGLITALFQVEWNRKNNYFCSQFVATAFVKAGVFPSDTPLTLIAPHDILNALPFELLYEGTLQEFHHGSTSLLMEPAFSSTSLPSIN